MNSRRRHLMVLGGCLVLPAVILAATSARASDLVASQSNQGLAGNCAQLVGHVFGQAKVTEAKSQPAGSGQPEMCVVLAQHLVRLQLKMEAFLPSQWVGVSLHVGGGGLDGYLPGGKSWSPYLPASHGVAVVDSNGGHEASDPTTPFDTSALEGSPEARVDYTYRALSETDTFGDALIRAYYHDSPRYRYFSGCSKGGTDALQAAARFPEHYDGILAQAPASHVSGWVARVASFSTLPPVPDATWRRVYSGYIKACDKLDGLRDGVVNNIAACRFDPSRLPGLTEAEQTTLRSISSDLKLSDGTVAYPRYWWGPQAGMYESMKTYGQQWMQHLIFDKNYDPASFNLDRDFPQIRQANITSELTPPTAGVASFVRQGKKVMIVMGTDDPAVSLEDNVNYYQEVRQKAGASKGNARMYLLPGVGHCGIDFSGHAKGANSVDMLGALRAWVESGQIPDKMVARSSDQRQVDVSRPVCEVGTYPRYNGKGDVNVAQNFHCTPDGRPASRVGAEP